MSFQNPAGLWLLLLLPLLILIYIIRSRYEDTPFSSTYIWKLSDRFLKKTIPLQRFRRILLFLLQLSLIVLFALAAAKPTVKDTLAKDYVVLLDCSAGMQVENEKGQSRFEEAVKQTEKIAKTLKNGHSLSVILAGEQPAYLIKSSTSHASVKAALQKAVCGYGNCNAEEALALASDALTGTKSPEVLFFTCRDYAKAEGVTVKNFSLEEWNVSFSALTAQKNKTGTEFRARLTSWNKDASLAVGLRINGKTVDAQSIDLLRDQETEVIFRQDALPLYDTAEVFVTVKDGFAQDNLFALCPNNDRCRVLLASKRPFYLKQALSALGNCDVTGTETLEGQSLSGFDLYIFDGMFPESYPTDGGVLVFGTEKLPEGLAASSFVESEGHLSANQSLDHPLFEGVAPKGCYVKGYTPLLANAKWVFPLYCAGNGVFAVKNEEEGPLFAVCSFDLHDSNLPLQADFLVMMRNLVARSLPSLVKEREIPCESTLSLYPPLAGDKLYLEQPDKSVKELSFSDGFCQISVSLPGIYTAAALQNGEGVYADFFVHVPKAALEKQSASELLLPLPEQNAQSPQKAQKSLLFWAALLILLLILTEWGLYYREQY
jgi:hypothetical protein